MHQGDPDTRRLRCRSALSAKKKVGKKSERVSKRSWQRESLDAEEREAGSTNLDIVELDCELQAMLRILAELQRLFQQALRLEEVRQRVMILRWNLWQQGFGLFQLSR